MTTLIIRVHGLTGMSLSRLLIWFYAQHLYADTCDYVYLMNGAWWGSNDSLRTREIVRMGWIPTPRGIVDGEKKQG